MPRGCKRELICFVSCILRVNIFLLYIYPRNLRNLRKIEYWRGLRVVTVSVI